VAALIKDKNIRKELIAFMKIQLSDNVKARVLDTELQNTYVSSTGKKKVRAQLEIYKFLAQKETVPKIIQP
jgi:polyphosphate kinase